MPEGDTAWLTAHRLNKALGGRPLTVSDFRVPALATVDLRGRTVTEVIARGKHILTRVAAAEGSSDASRGDASRGDGELTLHSHLRMDGSYYLSARGKARPRRHPDHMIRVLLGNDDWLATGYRVHDLTLVPRAAEGQFVDHLGPDLLGPDWNAELATSNLLREPDLTIGEALLDQRNLAGVGNMYKAEVLFMARVHPWTRVDDVAAAGRLGDVIAQSYRVLRMNRDHPEQSTTGYTQRGREHWVYERGGQPCLRCRTRIERREQGVPPRHRGTYWCPTCQPAPAREGRSV